MWRVGMGNAGMYSAVLNSHTTVPWLSRYLQLA